MNLLVNNFLINILHKAHCKDLDKDMKAMEEKQKKDISKKVLVIVVVTCLLLVGGIGIFAYNMYIHRNDTINIESKNDFSVSGSGLVVTEDNHGNISQDLKKANKGNLVVRMTQGWVFTDDCTKSNAYLGNSTRNEAPVRFIITMADTGEVLLTSPEVPVGSCIENFPLSVKLSPGSYDVVVTHQLMNNGEPYGNVNTATTIVVK